ncbi:Gfo/Idh/MocA family protein [Planctomycetota bacterium]
MTQPLSRRSFLNRAGAAVATFSVVPAYVMGGVKHKAPSEILNVGIIGAGGQGIRDMRELFKLDDVRITAICDVNEESDYSAFYYKGVAGRKPALKLVEEHYGFQPNFHGCAEYVDLHEMLDKDKSIDAVLIATPHHMNAPATQMGNYGHSGEGIRLAVEWLRDGACGDVTEIHAWTDNRNLLGQPIGRPKETPPVPPGLDWDRWQGPVKKRPYHPNYFPYTWRSYWAYSTGALGDMGCHNMDPAVWALELDHPTTVEARACKLDREGTPYAAMVYYHFAARGQRPAIDMTWYSGLMPPRPQELVDGTDLIGGGQGILFIGTGGKMIMEGWGRSPRLLPLKRTREYQKPPKTIARSNGHFRDWVDACKGGKPASANFDYGRHLTEIVLAGNVALRTGKKLNWDGKNMRATNCPAADPYIRPEYHNGWTL